jgi:hypothetical protein
MKGATITMEDESMKFLTFKLLDGWGNQKPSQIVEKIGIISPHPRTKKEEWLEQRRKKGIKGPWN